MLQEHSGVTPALVLLEHAHMRVASVWLPAPRARRPAAAVAAVRFAQQLPLAFHQRALNCSSSVAHGTRRLKIRRRTAQEAQAGRQPRSPATASNTAFTRRASNRGSRAVPPAPRKRAGAPSAPCSPARERQRSSSRRASAPGPAPHRRPRPPADPPPPPPPRAGPRPPSCHAAAALRAPAARRQSGGGGRPGGRQAEDEERRAGAGGRRAGAAGAKGGGFRL